MFGPPPLMSVRSSFYSMIPQNGLDFCLDVADINSYDGTSQTWVDLTGNGNSFFRGTTSGSQSSDPTFNGTAGKRTDSEFFSFDGDDLFTESDDHTFAESWHKDSATCSIVAIAKPIVSLPIFRTSDTNIGIGVLITLSGTSSALIFNATHGLGTTGGGNSGVGVLPIVADEFNLVGVSLDESAGTNNLTFQGNSGRVKADVSYSSPSSSGTNGAYRIGSGFGVTIAPDTSAIAAIAGYSRALSDDEWDGIYTRVKSRFKDLP